MNRYTGLNGQRKTATVHRLDSDCTSISRDQHFPLLLVLVLVYASILSFPMIWTFMTSKQSRRIVSKEKTSHPKENRGTIGVYPNRSPSLKSHFCTTSETSQSLGCVYSNGVLPGSRHLPGSLFLVLRDLPSLLPPALQVSWTEIMGN